MLMQMRAVQTFPSVRLASHSDGLPVDVALIAQLGVGAGDNLIQGVMARQRAHAAFVDALDEPSARIGGMNLAKGDTTSLYTFSVGTGGHPFHRHAGHRVFTAISGSAGTQLRFSTASSEQIEENPQTFMDALQHVTVPPDCLFTVRFGGGTWHQFVPLQPRSKSPALFALSCHTNELGGDLPDGLRSLVEANSADIPSLTEVLPDPVSQLLEAADAARIPTVELSLHAAPVSWPARLCAATRRVVGPWRSLVNRIRSNGGFMAERLSEPTVIELESPPDTSLLRTQLTQGFDFEDSFGLTLPSSAVNSADAPQLLAAVLEGFLQNRSTAVSALMTFRNFLVKPLRLRTSPLGCPVSSLLSPCSAAIFADKYPVLGQRVDPDGRRAEVILGADDRHLRFRSCVGVEIGPCGTATVTLGTRVQPFNVFGKFYMSAIDRVHRRYVSPTMLRLAVGYAVRQVSG
jgi:hypothetical protein